MAGGGSRVVDKSGITAKVAVDSTARGNIVSIAIVEGQVVVVLIIWAGRAAVVTETVVGVIRKDVIGDDCIIVGASIGIAHYQSTSPILQGRVVCNDYIGRRMVKVNTVVPAMNDQVIDDSSLRLRMITSMNVVVAGPLREVNQPDHLNKMPNH